MKTNTENPTHHIEFTIDGKKRDQTALGKTDLFACIRGMLKDGATEIRITTMPTTKSK